MKNRPKTIVKTLLVLALLVVPGALYAGPVNDRASLTQWDAQAAVVTGITPQWAVLDLRHRVSETLHRFIGNPNDVPPGACRAIAYAWNLGVFTQRSDVYFRALLSQSATNNCNIDFARNPTANADGSFDLLSVRPAK